VRVRSYWREQLFVVTVSREEVCIRIVDSLAILDHVLVLRQFKRPTEYFAAVIFVVLQPQQRSMIGEDLEWTRSKID
jgi:hypothetical protein